MSIDARMMMSEEEGDVYADLMKKMEVVFDDYKMSHGRALAILKGMSGITSAISSAVLLWKIFRSHKGVSTTQHRLLIGLCVSDIIFSLSFSTFNVSSPSDMDYLVWNARGNEATCDAEGFMNRLGGGGGLYYNCALILSYLAIVKYNKSDEQIRTKIEPFLHGVPIVVALATSITELVKKHFNVNTSGICVWPTYNPPHCQGYEVGDVVPGFEIPCGRGMEGKMISIISNIVLMFVPAIIIIASLGMIYRTVSKQEHKVERNFRNSIIQREPGPLARGSVNTVRSSRASLSLLRRSSTGKGVPVIRRKKKNNYRRAIMYKAFAYSSAWFLSYGFHIIGMLIALAGKGYPQFFIYTGVILSPLQGLFNLAVYMYPQVISERRKAKKETVSWRQALSRAFLSRGQHPARSRSRRQSGYVGTTRSAQKRSMRTSRTTRNRFNLNFRSIRRTERRRRLRAASEEEEKCEIQMPDTHVTSLAQENSNYVSNFASPSMVHVDIIHRGSVGVGVSGNVNPPERVVDDESNDSQNLCEFPTYDVAEEDLLDASISGQDEGENQPAELSTTVKDEHDKEGDMANAVQE